MLMVSKKEKTKKTKIKDNEIKDEIKNSEIKDKIKDEIKDEIKDVVKNGDITKENEPKKEKMSNVVNSIIEAQQKKFGKHVVITSKNEEEINSRIVKNNVVPTNSLAFNAMTGIGGLAKGRIFIMTGPAGIGKTTTLLACYEHAKKEGYYLVYVDAEHRLDIQLVKDMGLYDEEKFILILPTVAEEAFETIEKLLQTGKPMYIVIDSESALDGKIKSKKALEDWGQGKQIGRHAKLMSEFYRTINPSVSKTHSIMGVISHKTMKGIGKGMAYSDITGGEAQKYYATHLFKAYKADSGAIMDGDQQIGQIVVIEFKKTTTSLPPIKRKVALKYGHGFYIEYEALEIGIQQGVVSASGSWFEYDGIKVQGKLNMVRQLEENKKLLNKLRKEINR
jgi:protein RecA